MCITNKGVGLFQKQENEDINKSNNQHHNMMQMRYPVKDFTLFITC